jgi:hypothetical protein
VAFDVVGRAERRAEVASRIVEAVDVRAHQPDAVLLSDRDELLLFFSPHSAIASATNLAGIANTATWKAGYTIRPNAPLRLYGSEGLVDAESRLAERMEEREQERRNAKQGAKGSRS